MKITADRFVVVLSDGMVRPELVTKNDVAYIGGIVFKYQKHNRTR